MKNEVSWIIISFIFIFSVVNCFEIRVFSGINNLGNLEVALSNDTQETFTHDHCKVMEIFHEDFFRQSDSCDLSGIRTPSKKIHPGIITVPSKYIHNYWHPPKFI